MTDPTTPAAHDDPLRAALTAARTSSRDAAHALMTSPAAPTPEPVDFDAAMRDRLERSRADARNTLKRH